MAYSRNILQAICAIGIVALCGAESTKKFIKLSSGYDIPIIGFGTWQISPDDIDTAVSSALENGYRHIDTAFVYGNEEAIGKTLKKWFDKGGKREDLFVTTKLPPHGMRAESVESYLKLSLQKLGLGYVDMYLIHKPFGFVEDKTKHAPAKKEDGSIILDYETDHVKIWKAMEEQVKAGRTRSIGLSNFNETQIANVYDHAMIKPSNLQVELQAYNQQRKLREFCSKRSISVTAFSSLGSPGSTHEKKTDANLALPKLLEHPVVKKIAVAHDRSPAQVLLRHIVQLGVIVLPKSTKPARIRENIGIFDFELSADEMGRLNALDMAEQGRIFHYFLQKGVEKHPQYPFAAQLDVFNARSG